MVTSGPYMFIYSSVSAPGGAVCEVPSGGSRGPCHKGRGSGGLRPPMAAGEFGGPLDLLRTGPSLGRPKNGGGPPNKTWDNQIRHVRRILNGSKVIKVSTKKVEKRFLHQWPGLWALLVCPSPGSARKVKTKTTVTKTRPNPNQQQMQLLVFTQWAARAGRKFARAWRCSHGQK